MASPDLLDDRELIEQGLDALEDLFFLLEPDGDIAHANDAATEVLGYTDADIEALHALDVIAPGDRERVGEALETVAEEGSARVEASLLDKGGDPHPYDLTGAALTGPAGEIEAIAGIGRDIADRLAYEEHLLVQRCRLKAINEASVDGVLVVDADREVVTYNSRFLELWGLEAEDVAGASDVQLLERVRDRLANPERFRETVEALYEDPDETAHHRVELADGRVLDRHTAPIRGDGRWFGRVWFFRDITDLVEARRELERQRDRLEEFASVVSHDLRNPLTVALGHTELAMEGDPAAHLPAVADALDRMETLIEDVLALARQGSALGETETVRLGELIEEATSLVDATEATIAVAEDVTFEGDRSRLLQLFENLLRNAVDHGGPSVTVEVGVDDDGLYVQDDGPGIPPGEREAVFEHGYTTQEDGTGFGLAIVAEIVAAHGWSIRATGSPTGGARFEIDGVDADPVG